MGIMHYSFKKDFDKAKTQEERMKVFLKYGWDAQRLKAEIEEKKRSMGVVGGLHRVDYNDPQLLAFALSAMTAVKTVRTEDGLAVVIDDHEKVGFNLSMSAARQKELHEDPVYRFNELIDDYLALDCVDRLRH